MSINGGHLASNLGAVELTIALHKVFNSPDDKFIWDVSHQTYAHKILTGRNDDFHTSGNIKVFAVLVIQRIPSRSLFSRSCRNSPLFALGVAKNRDLTKRNEHVIPIIGDATLTCGMSLEALNNVSRDLKKFIVILNDNAMSISKNVGAITQYSQSIVEQPHIK